MARSRSTDLARARLEVTTKSGTRVDRETAWKWRDRAIAGYNRFAQTGLVGWLIRAQKDEDEALEHAAKVGDQGRFVGRVQRQIDAVKQRHMIPNYDRHARG